MITWTGMIQNIMQMNRKKNTMNFWKKTLKKIVIKKNILTNNKKTVKKGPCALFLFHKPGKLFLCFLFIPLQHQLG